MPLPLASECDITTARPGRRLGRQPHDPVTAVLVNDRLRSRRFIRACRLQRQKSLAERHRQPARTPAPDERDADGRHDDRLAGAVDALCERHRRSTHFLDPRRHFQHVVDAGRTRKIQRHRAHGEGDTVAAVQHALMHPEKAQEVGPPTLEKAHIGSMIGNAGKIRVLVIDAHRQDVAVALETAGEIRPAGICVDHGAHLLPEPAIKAMICAVDCTITQVSPVWCGVVWRVQGSTTTGFAMLFRSLAALLLATITIAPAIAAVDDALPGQRLQPPRPVGAASDLIVVAQSEGVADLIARVQRLEGQNRQLTGRVDELTNALRLLQQELAKSREDMEYRLQALEGGAPVKRGDAGKTPEKTLTAEPAANPAVDPSLAGAALGAPPADLGTIVVDPALAGGALQDENATAAAEANQPLDLTTLPRVDGDADGGVKSGLTPPGLPGVAVDTSQPVIAAAPTNLPKDEFDLAYGFLQRKDYEIAEASFRKFLLDHPDDALIPDAVHWLGESLFQRKQYRDAAEQFLKVTSDYSKSRRAPSSMLRLAMSLAQLGEKETACDTLREVGRRYPSASDTVKNAVKRELGRNQC